MDGILVVVLLLRDKHPCTTSRNRRFTIAKRWYKARRANTLTLTRRHRGTTFGSIPPRAVPCKPTLKYTTDPTIRPCAFKSMPKMVNKRPFALWWEEMLFTMVNNNNNNDKVPSCRYAIRPHSSFPCAPRYNPREKHPPSWCTTNNNNKASPRFKAIPCAPGP